MKHDARCKRIGEAARRFVAEKLSWGYASAFVLKTVKDRLF